MKKLLFLFPVLFYITSIFGQEEYKYDYIFFENSILPNNYFYSSTDYSKGSYVKNINSKLPVCKEKSFTAPNSLELNYTNGNGDWKANVTFPRIRGNDFFKNPEFLSFWIYPKETDEKLFPKVALSLKEKQRRTGIVLKNNVSPALSILKYINTIEKNGWKLVKIPLKDFGNFTKHPNSLVFSNSDNLGKGKVLIDQIELLAKIPSQKTQAPQMLYAKGYEQHVDLSWPHIEKQDTKYIKIYRSEDNKIFTPIGIQKPYFDRFTDFIGKTDKQFYYKISYLDYQYSETPTSKTAEVSTRKMTDEELLDMVQEASFRYYWEAAEIHSGLAKENIPGRQNMIATGASGFGIMAIIVGVERGFITRDQAIHRMKKMITFLKKCDKYHGAVSHFIDGPTGKTTAFFGQDDNGGDLVETSFLFQGLLAAREYFENKNADENQIRKDITQLWEAVEWDWYDKEKENKFLTWHWSKEHEWKLNHKLIGWNETMITYILAMASPTHSIDSSMYYNGWASQSKEATKYRSAWGKTDDGSNYTNGNYYHGYKLDVGVANGGPLFFAHYSFLGLDPNRVTDQYTNYFDNNKNMALINWKYCTENPNKRKGFNDSFWGLTASDGPWGYSALEPRKEIENGTMAPTGALASFPYTPKQSMAALKNMYRNHGHYLWGEYGFKDAVNLDANWNAKIFMGLNQAPVVIMIENYRTGLIWNLFMKNKEITNVLNNISK